MHVVASEIARVRPRIARPSGRRSITVRAGALVPGDSVLVAGATGGVGQLLTAKLLEHGYRVVALSRSADKVRRVLGDAPGLSVALGDLRDTPSLASALRGVDAVCCCTGTTAFPSQRWDGGNTPEQTDLVAVGNLVQQAAAAGGLKRLVLTSSMGVERYQKLPFSILNLFGVLKYKRIAEQQLERSGLPYTIVRPGRLTDGPYTSYDLNTLLKGIAGSRQDVTLSLRDDLNGEASRIAVAEAILQALALEETEGHAFSIVSKEGPGPAQDPAKWKALFDRALAATSA